MNWKRSLPATGALLVMPSSLLIQYGRIHGYLYLVSPTSGDATRLRSERRAPSVVKLFPAAMFFF